MNIRPKYVGTSGDVSIRRNYGDDARSEVILDNGGNIVLASCTQSNDFPVTAGTPIQDVFAGGLQDGVILKYNSTLTVKLFATYFGGNGDDACFVVSQSPLTGNYYIGGATTSNTVPLPGDKTGVIAAGFQNGVTDGFAN